LPVPDVGETASQPPPDPAPAAGFKEMAAAFHENDAVSELKTIV
jgi:hypothetical protein